MSYRWLPKGVGNKFVVMVHNQVLRNKLKLGRALWRFWTIVVLSVSIKDQSLTVLLLCGIRVPHLTRKITCSDHEAGTLIGLGIDLMYVPY